MRTLTHLLKMVLQMNNFEFNGQQYLQIGGTAMGTRVAPTLANIFMAEFECRHVQTYPLLPTIWLRFIDNIFLLWDHGPTALVTFVDHLNTTHPTINFTSESSIDQVRKNFLVDSMDVLCFSETWLNCDIPDELVGLRNFSLLRNDRRYGRGGGTCIYIRNKFDGDIMPVNDKVIEIQGVHLNGTMGPQPCKSIIIILVYRPPRSNPLEASTRLKDYITNIPDYEKK